MSKTDREKPGDAFGRQVPPEPAPERWNRVDDAECDEIAGECTLFFPDNETDVMETWVLVRTDLLVNTEDHA